jgi:hypothetical protein
MACCQPRSPGVGGMKRGRELADGRPAQLLFGSGRVEQVLFRSEEEGRCQVRPGGRQQTREQLQLWEHLAGRR